MPRFLPLGKSNVNQNLSIDTEFTAVLRLSGMGVQFRHMQLALRPAFDGPQNSYCCQRRNRQDRPCMHGRCHVMPNALLSGRAAVSRVSAGHVG